MNRNNIFKKSCSMVGATLIALSTGFTSCSSELDALPTQQKVDGNLVVDQKSAGVALNGIYYKYAVCGTDYYDVKSTGCSTLYEAYPADLAGVLEYYQGPYVLETHDVSSMESSGGMLWSSLYGTVNAANAAISQIESLDGAAFTGDKKQQMLGEAHAMRALAFYNLLRYFGYSWDINSPYGIILRTQQSMATTLPLSRSSVKDSYEQIISDLDYAIAHAPQDNDHFYATSWFAKGLKARILLMRGHDSDYADAAALCQDIIQNGPYALEDNYEDIFHQKGIDSQEVIFGIKPKPGQSEVYETYYYRGSAQFLPTAAYLSLFEGDPRLEQTFMVVPTEMIGYDEYGNYYFYTEDKYILSKHIDPDKMTFDDIEESQYQMRLSEIYLLRAEALTRTGNMAEAATLLKTVMSKCGISDFTAVEAATTQEAMLQQIFNEALRNLGSECGLEHDLMLRFPESITLAFNPIYENRQYDVFPIPQDEFKYNNALTRDDQNPGYAVESN